MSDCAICRGALVAKCIECEVNDAKRVCQGQVHSAVCGHVFHTECIARWLDTRYCCPLCGATWVYPWGLSLKQLVAAKSIDSEEKVLDLVTTGELDPTIYAIVDYNVRQTPARHGQALSSVKQRLLARTFGQYLNEQELETLLALKRPRNKDSDQ